MLRKFTLLAFVLAFAGCATSPQETAVTTPSYAPTRSIASDGCPSSSPCIFIKSYNGSQIVVRGENFNGTQSRYQVNIYIDGQYENKVMTGGGVFEYTSSKGEAPNGTKFSVKVLDFNGSGRHYEGETILRRSSQTNPNPGGGNQQPQQQAYRMPTDKLNDYADQQARTVANRVVKTYGELEKWKYNFTMGYWQGVQEYERSNAAQFDYENGQSDGRAQGAKPGYDAGYSNGYSVAKGNGEANARERYRSIVNTGRAPDTDIGTFSTPAFGGLSAPANACNTSTGYTSTLEAKLAAEMRAIRFGDDTDYLVYDATLYSLTFNEIYGWGPGKYEFTDSWFRETYAWNEWFENDLGGRYDKTNYRKLENDQREDFKAQFKREYNNVIDMKFYRKKTEYNAAVNARGQYYGVQLGKKKKYDAGCNAGYGQSYTPESIRGFNTAYDGGYRSGFGATVNYYNSNPVVTIDGIKLVDGNLNGVYELGESLGVEIGTYTNLGRVPARGLRVSMDGDGVVPTPSSETVSLDPSTSKAINQRVMNLAKIKEDVIADQAHGVNVAVGSTKQALSYTVSWAGTIEALVNLDPSQAATLKNFVIKNIETEYATMESAKDKTYQNGGKSKMNDLVGLHGRTPEGHRAILAKTGTELLAWQKGFKHSHNKWSTGKLRDAFEKMAIAIGGVKAK